MGNTQYFYVRKTDGNQVKLKCKNEELKRKILELEPNYKLNELQFEINFEEIQGDFIIIIKTKQSLIEEQNLNEILHELNHKLDIQKKQIDQIQNKVIEINDRLIQSNRIRLSIE